LRAIIHVFKKKFLDFPRFGIAKEILVMLKIAFQSEEYSGKIYQQIISLAIFFFLLFA
jgi:hypothetical protein